ncbi:MAG: hypothetical protein K8L91_29685 [Anaerolineae bacterium]|nr:hypothetical protein [Anaerolineae bacterium]
MITRILGIITLVAFIGVVAWINPGSALVASLVILPYLLLMMLLHWQCIRLFRRMMDTAYRPVGNPGVQPPPQTNFQSLTGLNL